MNTFREAVRTRDFTVTAQLQLTRDTDREELLRQAETLQPAVDAVEVTDNPNGSVHMSGLAASALLLNAGIDPVMHMTCRDRSRIALQSDVLGARALGITSLLMHRGDKLEEKFRPKSTQIFDTGSKRLLKYAQTLNAESSAELFPGAIITVFNPKSDWQAKSLLEKVDAGAGFLQTQLCFDTDLLRRYMERLVATRVTQRAHVVVTVATLRSAETARWLRDNLRGSVMPDAVVARLDDASDAEQEGVRICAELIEAMRDLPGVGGVNVLTPGDISTIPAAIHAAGAMGR